MGRTNGTGRGTGSARDLRDRSHLTLLRFDTEAELARVVRETSLNARQWEEFRKGAEMHPFSAPGVDANGRHAHSDAVLASPEQLAELTPHTSAERSTLPAKSVIETEGTYKYLVEAHAHPHGRAASVEPPTMDATGAEPVLVQPLHLVSDAGDGAGL